MFISSTHPAPNNDIHEALHGQQCTKINTKATITVLESSLNTYYVFLVLVTLVDGHHQGNWEEGGGDIQKLTYQKITTGFCAMTRTYEEPKKVIC